MAARLVGHSDATPTPEPRRPAVRLARHPLSPVFTQPPTQTPTPAFSQLPHPATPLMPPTPPEELGITVLSPNDPPVMPMRPEQEEYLRQQQLRDATPRERPYQSSDERRAMYYRPSGRPANRSSEIAADDSENSHSDSGEFNWTIQRREVALLLAEGISATKAARRSNLSASTIRWYLGFPEFKEEVQKIRKEVQEKVFEFGIAARVARVASLNDRWERLQEVIEARARRGSIDDADGHDLRRDAPGVETGVIATKQKVIGQGPNAREITESQVDEGLLAEMRALEKQAAQELGQWSDKTEITLLPKAYIGIDLDRI